MNWTDEHDQVIIIINLSGKKGEVKTDDVNMWQCVETPGWLWCADNVAGQHMHHAQPSQAVQWWEGTGHIIHSECLPYMVFTS